jgi:hypothetical protein
VIICLSQHRESRKTCGNIEHLQLMQDRRKTLVVPKNTAVSCIDQAGKVFQVVGQNVRRCLVCEELFTLRGACEHARVVCGVPRTQLGLQHVKPNWRAAMGGVLRRLQ